MAKKSKIAAQRRRAEVVNRHATRLRNRDAVDGRPRGYVGVAGVSRVRFRELAHGGYLPGITTSSW